MERQSIMSFRLHIAAVRAVAATVISIVALLGCKSMEIPMEDAELEELGTKYTAAWCSRNAASVAAFFAQDGSLTINGGAPSVGRAAITATAQGFMTDFPDMVVSMISITPQGKRVVYRWTLIGTNSGPGGTGNPVVISGYEEWTIGPDGLIAKSEGHFDEADYRRQLHADPGRPN